jgi:hypothetical protein
VLDDLAAGRNLHGGMQIGSAPFAVPVYEPPAAV